ncbi:helix-turn-helix domain-containing protein [Hydrogenophaga sp. YM1]|uniref:helix-turn-helix domain-containing protein n=1 Tax=Hydrogenophaga sp. YM1 TaxID=2806262 RepID=UPI0019597864|nr:helix-turn-helix domain-containing protein [Hydrogenophaga sp. YM1]QRR35610.1 helix-turn-helix domain-containing protein [Hydrogenophaga sp. YM1]
MSAAGIAFQDTPNSSSSSQAMFGPTSSSIDLTTPSTCTLLGLVVDSSLLESVLGPERPMIRCSCWANNEFTKATRGFLDEVVALLSRSTLTLPAVGAEDLATQAAIHFADVMSGGASEPLAYHNTERKRVFERAREFVLLKPDSPPTLLDLCRHTGVSSRKLTYCFQEVIGMSPQSYLRIARLNSARKEFARSEGDAGVCDIASRWGFWHYSRFSADYKKLFGELPSETLRQGRARHRH